LVYGRRLFRRAALRCLQAELFARHSNRPLIEHRGFEIRLAYFLEAFKV
jgi:hypothetical protein